MLEGKTSANRGVVLFIVLATLLIVLILANAILAVITSQSRMTFHQTSRIQAYYAALGVTNLVMEELRTGVKTVASCPGPITASPWPAGCSYTDTNFPHSLKNIDISGPDKTVNVIICAPGAADSDNCPGGCPGANIVDVACIKAIANYSYH